MKRIFGLVVLFALCFSTVVAADVIPWRKLLEFLPPELAGMKPSDKPTGQTITMGEQKTSTVAQDYGSDDLTGNITIFNGQMASMTWMSTAAMAQMEVDSSEMMMKKVKISDFDGVQSYEYESKKATAWVTVADGILVIATAEGVENTDSVIAALNGMKLKELSTLAASLKK